MKKENCKYFPCHEGLEDCSFCYCPIYPCEIKELGFYYKGVWDCSKCNLVHKSTNAELLKKNLYYNITIMSKK